MYRALILCHVPEVGEVLQSFQLIYQYFVFLHRFISYCRSLPFLDNDCLLSGSQQAVIIPLTSNCLYQFFSFLSYLTKVFLTLVTCENYTTKVNLLQIWTENNFVVTLISYMKQPMVIYPVILHGDTALPPACLISKLWLWCFKLQTMFSFIPCGLSKNLQCGLLEVSQPHGILTAFKFTLGNVKQYQTAMISMPCVVWACLTQDMSNLYH